MTKQKTSLSEEEVLHIAKLANLYLSKEEVIKFQQWLSETLSYIKILDEINTNNITLTYQVTGLTNVFRSDEEKPSLTKEQAIENTKSKYNGYFKVKAIFEEE